MGLCHYLRAILTLTPLTPLTPLFGRKRALLGGGGGGEGPLPGGEGGGWSPNEKGVRGVRVPPGSTVRRERQDSDFWSKGG